MTTDAVHCPQCGRPGKRPYYRDRDHPAGGVVRALFCPECGLAWDVLVRRIPGVRAVRPPEGGARECG